MQVTLRYQQLLVVEALSYPTAFVNEDDVRAITRAISIRQPWVELILRGQKTEEYRSRATTIEERVYVYASATPADWPPAWRALGLDPGDLPTGKIVGTVEIVGCYWNRRKDAFAYVLRAPRRLRSPITPRNQPQPVFWRPVF